MPLMLAHNATKILAVGMSGSGKTLWANGFIERSKYDFYFVFDHDGQFAQRNKVNAAFTSSQILTQLRAGFVVFNPTEMFSDLEEAFEWFCKYAYLMSERGSALMNKTKLLFCDEVQDIVGLNRIGEYTSRVIVSGRNRGLDFLTCSLQYNMVHNTIRGQATQTVAFATEEALALKALAERGFKTDEISALKKGEYVLRNKSTASEIRGKVF